VNNYTFCIVDVDGLIKKRKRKPTVQSRMDNLETHARKLYRYKRGNQKLQCNGQSEKWQTVMYIREQDIVKTNITKKQ